MLKLKYQLIKEGFSWQIISSAMIQKAVGKFLRLTGTKKRIEKQLTRQMDTDFAKVKLATRIEVEGNKCYECRVNPPQLPPVRVAFIRDENQVKIVYLTTNIVKADFTHDLEHFLGGK